jgi:outer membrane lipoprotein SlyB
MIRNLSRVAILALCAAGIAACSDSVDDRRLRGQVAGGATGALLGATIGGGSGQAVAIGAGAVLGSIAGGRIADGSF